MTTPTSAIEITDYDDTVFIDKRVVCASFSNISYSRNDTEPTRREIVSHNAAYKTFGCGGPTLP